MSNLKVLITGSSGTGKTTLYRELKALHLNALDADDRSLNLCSWVEIATGKDFGRGYPNDFSVEKYDWRWNDAVLRSLLEVPQDMYLCGNANNATQYYPLFDYVFLLTIPEKEQRLRMMSRTDHDFGQDKATQDTVVERQAALVGSAREYGAIIIDASAPPSQVINNVLGQLK